MRFIMINNTKVLCFQCYPNACGPKVRCVNGREARERERERDAWCGGCASGGWMTRGGASTLCLSHRHRHAGAHTSYTAACFGRAFSDAA